MALCPGNEEIQLRMRLVRLENIINENIEELTRKTEEIDHIRLKQIILRLQFKCFDMI